MDFRIQAIQFRTQLHSGAFIQKKVFKIGAILRKYYIAMLH